MNRPRYTLAMFDEAWKPGDADRRTTDPKAGGGRRKAVEPKPPEAPKLRDPKTGEFVSATEFERILKERTDKEHELNQENAKRRAENKELKDTLKTVMDAHDSMKQLALRTQTVAALTAAKAVDPDVVTDAFLRWAGDKVKVSSGLAVEGLTSELVSEFQKVKPKLFEGPEGNGQQRVIDADSVKRNATSNGLSPGGGSGGETQPVKIDFSKATDAGTLEAIVDGYARTV
jgi:hypothetical protein